MKKRPYIYVIIILLLFSVTLCGCVMFGSKTYQSGIFDYQKKAGNTCCITDFNGTDNSYDVIEIPDYINGMKVTTIYPGEAKTKKIEHKYVKSLYINYTVDSVSSFLANDLFYCESLEKIVINNCNTVYLNFGFDFVANNCLVIVPKLNIENSLSNNYEIWWIKQFRLTPANIEYYYNFENAENGGYYRIDYIRDPDETPYQFAEPLRQGYTFGGWYLEPQCINLWDNSANKIFEMPPELSRFEDKNGETIEMDVKSLKLYAKWIKN